MFANCATVSSPLITLYTVGLPNFWSTVRNGNDYSVHLVTIPQHLININPIINSEYLGPNEQVSNVYIDQILNV